MDPRQREQINNAFPRTAKQDQGWTAADGFNQEGKNVYQSTNISALNSAGSNAWPKRNPQDEIQTWLQSINTRLLIPKMFYFFFFSAFGSLFPLMAVYFKQLGLNAVQTGSLIGIRPFIEFMSAPFWSSLADRFRKCKVMLMLSLFCWIVFTLA